MALKILAIVTGALLVVAGIPMLLSGRDGSVGKLGTQRDVLKGQVENQETLLRGLRRGQKHLAEWKRRALPPDPALASRLYQTWLREVLAGIELDNVSVNPSDPVPGPDRSFSTLRFRVTGNGTLEQLVELLHEFYTTDHLHLIHSLSITPIKDSEKLELSLLIEALALRDAENQEKLSSGKLDRLAKKSLDEYIKTVVWRTMEGDRKVESGGLFASYAPPPPPAPPSSPPPEEPPGFEHMKFTVVSGITQVDGKPQVWLDVRPKGKVLKKYEGESFEIDELTGIVERIELKFVTIQIAGQRRVIELGKTLDEAAERSPIEPPEPETPDTEEPDAESPDTEEPEAVEAPDEEPVGDEPDADESEAEEPADTEPNRDARE